MGAGGLGPFDLTGGPFLALYAVLFVCACLAGIAIPRLMRPRGHDAIVTDPDELAVLSGGPLRLGEAVIAHLLANGTLEITGKEEFRVVKNGGARSAAERAVVGSGGTLGWSKARSRLKPEAKAVTQRLEQRGLMLDGMQAMRLRLLQTVPYLLLFGFGFIKLMIGMARDRPVGFLAVLLVATAIAAAVRALVLDRRTRAGMAALKGRRSEAHRLSLAPMQGETGLAVALFGTAVLAGSPLAEFHTMRVMATQGSGCSGSTDSSSGGGDSGCGGGGCGGCGS